MPRIYKNVVKPSANKATGPKEHKESTTAVTNAHTKKADKNGNSGK